MAPLKFFSKTISFIFSVFWEGKYDCRLEALDPSGARVNRE